jgi:hypothetical protein
MSFIDNEPCQHFILVEHCQDLTSGERLHDSFRGDIEELQIRLPAKDEETLTRRNLQSMSCSIKIIKYRSDHRFCGCAREIS